MPAVAAEQSPTGVVTTTAAAAAAAGWLRELGSLRDDQERIDLLAEVLAMADAGEPSHALVQHARRRIQSARTCGLSPEKPDKTSAQTAARKRKSPKSTTRSSKSKRRSSSMTCTITTEKTSSEQAVLTTSSPEKETVRREKDTEKEKEKEVKRRNRSKTKKSTEESLTDSPSSGSSGEIAAIASAGEALASNLSREALAATTVGTKRARSGSARLLSKIKIKHTSSTFGTSHEGHRTKYDLDDKMEILEHDEDGLSDQEQPKKGIRSRLVKGHSAVVLESAGSKEPKQPRMERRGSQATSITKSIPALSRPAVVSPASSQNKGLLSRMFGGGGSPSDKMAHTVLSEEATWRAAFARLGEREVLIAAHACSYNGGKGMLYISSEHVGFLERLSEQHASVIKKLWLYEQFIFVQKASNRSVTITTRDGQICFAKFDAGHQEFAYATLHAQFAPYASRTQSFHLAIDERDIQTVRILLRDSETTKQQIKATFNRSETPLASALQANDAEIVKLFLQYYRQEGLDINAPDEQGNTPLHVACLYSRSEVLELLLAYEGIHVTMENEDGNTPLHYFCRSFPSPTCQALLRVLLSLGADPNKPNQSGETPLHKAILNNSVRVLLIECLLDNGADVNSVSKLGESALHYAVRLGRKDVVSRLLCAGADTELRANVDGKTPTEAAVASTHAVIANLLQRVDELLHWLRAVEAQVLMQPLMARDIFLNELGVMDEADFNIMLERIEANNNVVIPDKTKLREAWAVLKDRKMKELTKAEAMQLAEKLQSRDVAKFKHSIHKVIGEARQGRPNPRRLSATVDALYNDDHWIIRHPDLEFTQILGDGTSGKVYRGLYKGMDVAIKVLYKSAQKEGEPFHEIIEEIKFLSFFEDTSPEIVRFYGVCLEPAVCLVMEFCERGSLHGVLKDEKTDMSWEMAISFIQATVRGIHLLHTSQPQVLHRDLKTLNLLVTHDWQIKVADFGLARANTNDNQSTLARLCGTLFYCAPELLFGEASYTTKADIYSLGIVLWEIIARCINGEYERPYAELGRQHEIYIVTQVCEFDQRPTLPPGCPEVFVKLVNACWNPDPDLRPSSDQVLSILDTVAEDYERSPETWEKTRLRKTPGS